MDPMAEIRETFFQECEEQLAELESGLMRMEAGETDSETVNAVFRAVHSIKGGEGGVRAVLVVDGIQGQRQVVIKSLEANYQAVPGIAAATVMGDGRVALILDVDAIVSVTRSDNLRADACRVEPTLMPAS
ncbi:hypothetical protein FE249_06420 [Acidiphilium multivorum]|uniref:chemotaxis protein CheW n=1 Tax=Acidiphilium multivorum TaxID=62140 RepID=UPI001F4C4B26|nr:chemotaxis protein CheW [Acidiphilium multivorum]UNC13888.1 hypothetical protein FE249_06420 [Acidiphilium multivorum]